MLRYLTLLALLLTFLMLAVSPVFAACPLSCVASWSEPTTNIDGSPLTDLAGYRVYVDGIVTVDTPAPNVAPVFGSRIDAVLPPLAVGTHGVDVTAYDLTFNESGHSMSVLVVVDPPSSDITAPTVQIGTITPSRSKRTVALSAADETALARVEVTVNGTTTTYLMNSSTWSATVSLPNSKNVTLTVRVVDTSGNAGIASQTWRK